MKNGKTLTVRLKLEKVILCVRTPYYKEFTHPIFGKCVIHREILIRGGTVVLGEKWISSQVETGYKFGFKNKSAFEALEAAKDLLSRQTDEKCREVLELARKFISASKEINIDLNSQIPFIE